MNDRSDKKNATVISSMKLRTLRSFAADMMTSGRPDGRSIQSGASCNAQDWVDTELDAKKRAPWKGHSVIPEAL
jgi:hypothetical protein